MRSVAQVGYLALAASSLYGSAQGLENITDDTFFYGLSEPVYPSRKSTITKLLTREQNAWGKVTDE